MQVSNHHVTLGFRAKDDIEKTLAFVSGGMKTIIQTVLYLPMAALLITTALAGPAAGEVIPFNGRLEGKESFDFVNTAPGADIKILGSGKAIVIPATKGQARNLGKLTATWEGDIFLSRELQPLFRHFVAANGDEIWSEGLGAGTPPPNQNVVSNFVITGGTGRFEDATGSFAVDRLVFKVKPPFTDLETVGSFEGFITTVGSSAHAVPEPASMTLALLGLLGLVTRCRWKGR